MQVDNYLIRSNTMNKFEKYLLISCLFSIIGAFFQSILSAYGIEFSLSAIGFMIPILDLLTKENRKK